MKKTYVGVLGIIFIVIGVVGALGIWISFDWETWGRLNELSIYEEEAALMKPMRDNAIILGFVAFVGNLAIGVVLLALDNIIGLLKGISK